jgi:hypothetical protein
MPRNNFRNDMTGRPNRMDYTSKSNVVPEARALDHANEHMGPTEAGATSSKRTFNPQKSPFSSAARECDLATTPENYYDRKGMQPR